MTWPLAPLSLPAMTRTVSPFLIFMDGVLAGADALLLAA